MIWFWLAIAASFLWACANLLGKYTLFELNKETSLVLLFSASVFALVVLPFFSINFSIIALIDGIFWAGAYYFYTQGLFQSEVSKAIALLLTMPIFVAIISHLFLGETLDLLQYAGIMLAVIGAMIISVDDLSEIKEMKIKKGPIAMILASILFAISDVLAKYSLSFTDPVSSVFVSQITVLIIGVVLLVYWRNHMTIKSGKLLGFAALCGFLSCLGAFLYIFSYSQILVSLAEPIETVQPMFVFFMATAISLVKPNWLKENITLPSLLIKASALFLLIIGVWLVVK